MGSVPTCGEQGTGVTVLWEARSDVLRARLHGQLQGMVRKGFRAREATVKFKDNKSKGS